MRYYSGKVLVSLVAPVLPANPPFKVPDTKTTKELTARISDSNIPGIQLIFSSKVKEYEYNAGVVMNHSDKKVASDTIFEAASLNKAVFAYTVLRLYDRWFIDLNIPIMKIIGSYTGFDPANPLFAGITARMVLRWMELLNSP